MKSLLDKFIESFTRIYSKRYICTKCGYKWETRKSKFGNPSYCPSCHSKKIVPFDM